MGLIPPDDPCPSCAWLGKDAGGHPTCPYIGCKGKRWCKYPTEPLHTARLRAMWLLYPHRLWGHFRARRLIDGSERAIPRGKLWDAWIAAIEQELVG